MKNYLNVGMLFLTVVMVSFTTDKGNKLENKTTLVKEKSEEVVRTKIDLDNLTRAQLAKMTLNEFRSYLLTFKGDPSKYVKRYIKAKMSEKNKPVQSAARGECDIEAYTDLISPHLGFFSLGDVDLSDNTVPYEWPFAQGGPGFWKVRSLERLQLMNLNYYPGPPSWVITGAVHESSSVETSCPLVSFLETDSSITPEYNTPGQPAYGTYVVVDLEGIIYSGFGVGQVISNLALVHIPF